MLKCLFFALFVLLVMFLVPQGANLFRSAKAATRYKCVLLTVYVGGILWLTLLNRWNLNVSSLRFKPFYTWKQLLNCWFGFQKISQATCRSIFRNSSNLWESTHATPIEDVLLNIVLCPWVFSYLTYGLNLIFGKHCLSVLCSHPLLKLPNI